MKQYENNITFELNETLSFELGQEIEEMISISLDPDIIIQSYEEYIQIRGLIVLSGKYYRCDYMERKDVPRQKQHTFRYVEKVINEDEQTTSFSHRFPVEISVSKERVNKVEDIVVTVDSFDYELPTSDTLQVYASLHIYGIIPEKMNDQTTEDTTPDMKKSAFREELERYENEDVKTEENKPQIEEQSRVVNIDTKRNEQKQMEKMSQSDEKQLNEQNKVEKFTNTEEKTVHTLKPTRETIETNTSDASSENKIENVNEDEEVQKVVKIDKKDEKKHRHEKEISEDKQGEEAIQVELNEGLEDGEIDIADVTFLTELFASEEETYTQVKIYIAQSDDTLEAIAKRYDVPVLQLLKDNQMSIDTIEDGQLITIRQRKKE